jgi:hypothetical protein
MVEDFQSTQRAGLSNLNLVKNINLGTSNSSDDEYVEKRDSLDQKSGKFEIRNFFGMGSLGRRNKSVDNGTLKSTKSNKSKASSKGSVFHYFQPNTNVLNSKKKFIETYEDDAGCQKAVIEEVRVNNKL